MKTTEELWRNALQLAEQEKELGTIKPIEVLGATIFNFRTLCEQQERERLSSLIHYPECWDTACYKTLEDALTEIGCNPDCCIKPNKEKK